MAANGPPAAPHGSGDPPSVPPLLRLPRELRDQIYDCVFELREQRSDRALRIERRNIKHFHPTAATILLVLHHEYLLLNRQVATEALEVLLKRHTVLFSCGPYVLKTFLTAIEHEQGQQEQQWLQWMKSIKLDWTTFPNLRMYPPNRENGKDEWWWENDNIEIDVDYVRGAQYSGHYDEYDYDGEAYDDNLYAAEDTSLYPTFAQPPDPADPFGFSTHYPFSDPTLPPAAHTEAETQGADEVESKLQMLVNLEVVPLFEYFATPTFNLSSITLPLYFVSRQTYHQRNTSRPGYGLPLKLRYWVQVALQALLMLHHNPRHNPSGLKEVKVKYMPWDVWASMDSSDDLGGIVERGVWFDEDDATTGEGGGEAFRSVWQGLAERDIEISSRPFDVKVKMVKWEGDLSKDRVGDELEIVFTRSMQV